MKRSGAVNSPCVLAVGFLLWTAVAEFCYGSTESSTAAAKSVGNDVIRMRIISDPVSLAHGAVTRHDETEDADDETEAALDSANDSLVMPAAFTGPDHFRLYDGRCYTLEKSNFEYKICPFQNITQRETSYAVGRKRATRIIGIWYDWIIEEGNFAGWNMQNGEMCGNKPRSAKVEFACNDDAGLWDVTEPHQCAYHAVFKLPQACSPDALLIYPMLSDELQIKWDIFETQRLEGDLTEKGFNLRLMNLMRLAGFVQNVTETPVALVTGVTPELTQSATGAPMIQPEVSPGI
ncbi:N-acetylglucosamine-1-phosphotransferase subunit gamma-like isoform X2 [Paramacrobiotus metropolitanus]|uniref:N-acetylglucosamine-1-phosphotransferase subunit gamma-like isoform X2 n=1 Tax=Paramacrobiotus metropolitanus TaxID=2943436 RepID=UPI00244562ED|nr:N-acetylglucosamine-1-phosphotransferase subunit gamma-like isoform X2 [Paramacrobiotus metropolitanus]